MYEYTVDKVDYGSMLERAKDTMGGRKKKKPGRKKEQFGELLGAGLMLGVGATVIGAAGKMMKKGIGKVKK